MGLLMDTLEDSSERFCQFLSPVELIRSERVEVESPHPRLLVDCPLCPTLLLSEKDLQDHVFASHRRAGTVYITLNGRIIGDLAYSEGGISQLRVSLLGTEPAHLECRLADRLARTVEIQPGRHLDISHLIPGGFVGLIAIVISSPHFTSSFEIHNRALPKLDFDRLDRAVDELQRPLLKGNEPHWIEWKAQYVEGLDYHSLERRYLSGQYEYLFGGCLEQKSDRLAGIHFERAFGCLRPFRTDLSHTERCILALKMNWFSVLQMCSEGSVFWPANLFFNPSARSVPGDIPLRKGSTSRRHIGGLWADSFLERILATVVLFQKRDYEGTNHLVTQLWEDPLARDPNNEVKLWLIEARTLRAQGRVEEARRSYDHLRHHPLFGREAEEIP